MLNLSLQQNRSVEPRRRRLKARRESIKKELERLSNMEQRVVKRSDASAEDFWSRVRSSAEVGPDGRVNANPQDTFAERIQKGTPFGRQVPARTDFTAADALSPTAAVHALRPLPAMAKGATT